MRLPVREADLTGRCIGGGPTLVVEFVGMPGSGKSTTARALASLLPDSVQPIHVPPVVTPTDLYTVRGSKGILRRAYSLLRVIKTTGRLAIRFPGLAGHYLLLAAVGARGSRNADRPPWGYISAFQFHALRRLSLREKDYLPGITILEQSVYMDIPNAALLSSRTAADWVVRETPTGRDEVDRLFVFLECGPDVLKSRLASREGHPRSRGLLDKPHQIPARVDTLAAIRSALEEMARGCPRLHVLAIRTDLGPTAQDAAASISERITTIWLRLTRPTCPPKGIRG